MKSAGARWAVVLITAVTVVMGGRWLLGWLFPADGGGVAVANQLWIERLPRNERDLVHHLVLLERDQRLGNLGRTSRWRIEIDLVRWRWEKPRRLEVSFPQHGHHIHLDTRAWECKGKAPAPFELCLELSCDGKTATFYSHKDWVIRPGEEVPGSVRAALPALTPSMEALASGQGSAGEPGDAVLEGPWPFDEAD
jgi:hypothetical protein